ncbi:MAG TPA: Crp/Fnr family transcriptional regulator [Dongiaceae bacterium]|nr:Crp/Fnr family transcriptional regulator [Dongiaceae bacterium]
MRYPGDTPVHRKFGTVIALTEADEAVLESALAHRERIAAGALVIGENSPSDHAYAVLEGWALRFRVFQDGRRQISRLFLPGDFIGLSNSLFGVPDQSVVALTDVVVAKFRTRLLADQLRTSPRLWMAAMWSYARDRAILDERIASIGRRSAYERLAHILVELHARLEFGGQVDGDSFVLPLTQEHLADLLGLTSIHINRVLRRLRQEGLIALEGRVVRILARDRLMEIADFDPRYLLHRL